MTVTRTSHRSRSLALSSLNRIRSTTLLDPRIDRTKLQENSSVGKKLGRLSPGGRGGVGAVKVALTALGENVWLVSGPAERRGETSKMNKDKLLL